MVLSGTLAGPTRDLPTTGSMTDAKSASGSPTQLSRVERTFVDGDGLRWRVYEQPFADYDRRSGVSLIFAADVAVRRVRNYPADWFTLTDAALAELSWKA